MEVLGYKDILTPRIPLAYWMATVPAKSCRLRANIGTRGFSLRTQLTVTQKCGQYGLMCKQFSCVTGKYANIDCLKKTIVLNPARCRLLIALWQCFYFQVSPNVFQLKYLLLLFVWLFWSFFLSRPVCFAFLEFVLGVSEGGVGWYPAQLLVSLHVH